MTNYTITTKATGIHMGTYAAADEEGAVLAYSQDAGYESIAQAASACDLSTDEYVAELIVEAL